MQFAGNLTNRQVVEAARSRIDGKYDLSSELRGPSFHFSMLSDCRIQLVEHEAQEKLLSLHLKELVWNAGSLAHGCRMKRKYLPYCVQLFATNGDIDREVMDHPAHVLTTYDLQLQNSVRWQIEQLYCELKELTGSEQHVCRKARSQRSQMGCCYYTWLALLL